MTVLSARPVRPLVGRLLDRARVQQCAFTRPEALFCGFQDRDLRAWCREGWVVNATRGGYYLAPEREPGWSELTVAEQNSVHELRRIAAVLRVVPDVFIASHRSALRMHELPCLLQARASSDVHLMPEVSVRTKPRRPGVKVHHPSPGLRVGDDVRAVSVEDAVVQEACLNGLLGGLVPADAALHEGRLDLHDLAATIERVCGMPGAAGTKHLVELVDGRSESPGETRTRLICFDAGIPVTPQVWISDEGGRFARVDLLVDGHRVAIEFDGLTKYRTREDLREEKVREQRLHRAGYVVVRVIWKDLANPSALVARIRAAVAQASETHS